MENQESDIQRRRREIDRLRVTYEQMGGDSVNAGAAFRVKGIKDRISELERQIIQLRAGGDTVSVAVETPLPPSRGIERYYDSSHIYRSSQPEIAETIPQGDRNLYPNSKVGTFIHKLGPHTELLTLVGVRNLVIPIEIRGILTKGERLAAYVSKGSLSWAPSNLERFGRNYLGLPEFLMVQVYEDAASRFPRGELESIDDINPRDRVDLSERLKNVSVIVRRSFRDSFFERIEDFHGAYRKAAFLNRPQRTREIYEAVTSSS